MNLNDHEDRIAASAQYVIGLLEGDELAEFERALTRDQSLASEVGRWRDHFLGLTHKVAPITPSPDLWPRIDADIARIMQRRSAPVTAPTPRITVPPRAPSLWSSLAFWRGLSAMAVAASVVMGTLLATRTPEVQLYTAVLRSPAQDSGWIVQVKSGTDMRLIPLDAAIQVPVGRSLELWTQPPQASAPVSLGLIQPGRPIAIPLERLPGLAPSQLFAISLDPPADRRRAPTGPILFAGNIEKL
ncbi:MAG: anti-sigma factor [Burkholderiaceae bacterium]